MDIMERQTAVRLVAERLRGEARRLFNILAKVKDTQGVSLNFNTGIGDGHATTLRAFFARIEAAAALMVAIADSKQVSITPHVWWTNLNDAASHAVSQCAAVSDWAEPWLESEGFFIEVSTFILQAPAGQRMDAGSPIKIIDQQIDTVLDHGLRFQWASTRLEPTQSAEVILNQERYISDLANVIGKVKQLSRDATDIERRLQKRLEDTQSLEAETQSARTRSGDNANAIAADRERISNLIEDIDRTRSKAEALDQRVTEYLPKFAEFDRALDQRTQTIKDGQEKLNALLDANAKLGTEADRLVINAREALKWATAQGLAQGFSLEAQTLDKPIASAIRAVYVSLALFAVWAFVLFVVPHALSLPLPSFTTFDPNHVGTSIAQGFLALGTRLALLFPAIYLVLFCNKRYRELFIVREQYTFKKAIATAVPGFKEQAAPADADEHVRAMTAAAFERLLFNPREAATRDLSGEARGGPLSRWLVRIVARAIDETRKLGEKRPPQ